MSKSKNYLRLGIVLAAFAAVISLMCVVFSYADVNELTGTNNAEGNQVEAVVGGEEQGEATEEAVTNDAWTVTIELQGISDEVFKKYCSFDVNDAAGAGAWDSSTNSFTTNSDAIKYNFYEPGEPGVVAFNVSFDEEVRPVNINPVISDSSKVAFVKWDGFTGEDLTENSTISAVFEELNPEYDTAVISGKVQCESTGEKLANVPVFLASKNSGEVYVSTTTNSNGEYTLNNVKPEWINDADNNPSFMYCSYPGYDIFYSPFIANDPRVVDNIAYFEDNDMDLDIAEVNVSGADHHQVFDMEMTIHMPRGEQKWIFHLPFFGLENSDLNKGAEFVVDENGLITGTATTEFGDVTVTTNLKCQSKCDDGYKFSYIDLNGTKYNAGDPIVLDGVSEYTAVVNYEAVAQPENVTAQTGDAIPFAVLIALGIVAGLSVVAIRKFSK